MEGMKAFLQEMPVWVGPVVVVVFCGLGWAAKALLHVFADENLAKGLGGAGPVLGYAAAAVTFLAWVWAEISKLQRRRLLDQQSGVTSIRDLSWQELEHLVAEAYRRQGYGVEETGSPSGDGGVDVRLSRPGELVLVQCKQWRTRRVGVRPARELYGVMASEGATRGVLVTCGSFTPEAQRFAEGKPIELVGGRDLWELVRAVQAPGSVGERRTEPIARSAASPGQERVAAAPESTTATTATATTPACPKCGSDMVLRKARKGEHAGTTFWGCSQYPACRGIRQRPTD